MNINDVVTADEAAALLGVKKQSLYVYVSRGLIRTVKRPGGNRRGYVRGHRGWREVPGWKMRWSYVFLV